MKTTLIALALIGMVVIAGIVFATANLYQTDETTQVVKSCSACNNTCTKQSNCGRESCQALQNKTCGCNRG